MTDTAKLCVDCKHYTYSRAPQPKWWEYGLYISPPSDPHRCGHECVSPVTGHPFTVSAERMRRYEGPCGIEGKFFEPK